MITHLGDRGPVEVARHLRATPGSPRIDDGHFPPALEGALQRTARARTAEEAAFLAIGQGARLWLTEAAEAGTARIRVKMDTAVQLAGLFGTDEVDAALGHAAVHARFAEGDLAAIGGRTAPPVPRRAPGRPASRPASPRAPPPGPPSVPHRRRGGTGKAPRQALARLCLRMDRPGAVLKRGEYLRLYPPGTWQFTAIYGRRNATESLHKAAKRTMPRLPAYGSTRQQLFVLALSLGTTR